MQRRQIARIALPRPGDDAALFRFVADRWPADYDAVPGIDEFAASIEAAATRLTRLSPAVRARRRSP